MKAQLFVCGFLPGVTAAVLSTQSSLAAPLPIGKFGEEIGNNRFSVLPDEGFRIGESTDLNVDWQQINWAQTNWQHRLSPSGINQGEKPLIKPNASIFTTEFTKDNSIEFTRDSSVNYVEIFSQQLNENDTQTSVDKKLQVPELSQQTTLNLQVQGTKDSSHVLINTLKNPNVQSQDMQKFTNSQEKNSQETKLSQAISQPVSVSQIKVNHISTAAQLTKPVVHESVSSCGMRQSKSGQKLDQKPDKLSQVDKQQLEKSCKLSSADKKLELAQSGTRETNPTNPTNPLTPLTRLRRYTPNPNPLLFPTKPEEVKVRLNQVITLPQALEIARRNNNDLRVALLQLETAQAALREAQASLLPNLNLNTTITRQQSASGQIGVEAEERAGTPDIFRNSNDVPSTAFSSDLQLSYSLYTSGARRARIREAEEQVRASELTVEQRSEEIRLNVATQYYNLQQTDQSVRIARSAVRNAQQSLEDAQALERAGVGTRFDVLRSQVNLANAQQELTNAISNQQVEQRRFAVLLNLPQSVTLRATDDVRIANLWERTLEETIILALQNRPELQQELVQREINEQRRRQALSQLGPQVSLIANYELLDQFDDGIAVTDGYSLGVRATLNLFDGGAARAQATQASKNIAIAETTFSSRRDQVRFEVEESYAQLESNLKNVNTATTALEQAQEALRLARLRFQAGVGTQTEVINSENDLTRAEANRINAILDYNRALANLERAVTLRSRGG